MTYDSDDAGKLREAVKMLKRRLSIIALHLKILAARCFRTSLKDKSDQSGNYWRTMEKNRRYSIRPGEDPEKAGEQAVRRRTENNRGRSHKIPSQKDIDTFDFKHEPPEKGAMLERYISYYETGDPVSYLYFSSSKIAGSDKLGWRPMELEINRVERSLLSKASKFAKYELFRTEDGIATKKKLSKKAKDKLIQEIKEYVRMIEPELMAALDEYNRQLQTTYERSRMAYRSMDENKFEDLMANGLQPNPNFFKGKHGVIYCSVSRTTAMEFRDNPIMVQFKDVEKKGFALEYIPLFGLKLGNDNIIENSKYGAVRHIKEHEVRLSDNTGAVMEVVYIMQNKNAKNAKELVKYVRGLGWDGKIVIIKGDERPKGLNL